MSNNKLLTKDQLMKRSFLVNYEDYVQWQESPLEFHLWVALTLVGAITQREVHYDMGYFKIFTNLYTSIIAESAICRKSSAIDIGMDIFLEATLDLPIGDCIVQGKASPKAILKFLQKNSLNENGLVFIHSDEFGVFLAKDMLNLGIVELLTELYTCKAKHDHLMATAESITVYNAFPVILSAGVPSYIRENAGNALKEGFVGRMNFVHSEIPRKRIADIRRVANMPYLATVREVLIEQLKFLAEKKGAFRKEEAAFDVFDNWYNSLPEVEKDRVNFNKTFQSGYMGRVHILADKLAMIFALAKEPLSQSELVIDEKSMLTGIKCAGLAGDYLNNIFKDMPGTDIFATQHEVESFMMKTRRITRAYLTQAFRKKITIDNLNYIIDALLAANVIIETQSEGRATVYYYVPGELQQALELEQLTKKEALEKVVKEYKKEKGKCT